MAKAQGTVRHRTHRLALDVTPAQHCTLTRYCALAGQVYMAGLKRKLAAYHHDPQTPVPTSTRLALDSEIGSAIGATELPDATNPGIRDAIVRSALADADRTWLSMRAKNAVPSSEEVIPSRPFRIHLWQAPNILALNGSRRLYIRGIGNLRTHNGLRRLSGELSNNSINILSVSIWRKAHRWYLGVVISETGTAARLPSKRQHRNGVVGVDLGIQNLATLSTGTTIPNPRIRRSSRRRLAVAESGLCRTVIGSNRHLKKRDTLRRRHHEIAEKRRTAIHTATKYLATQWNVVAIEDLNVMGMSTAAQNVPPNQPQSAIVAKNALNRSLRDVSLGRFRQQLTYKVPLHGGKLVVCPRWYPSTKRCSRCGLRNNAMPLSRRVFTCSGCGFRADRDFNAALNLMAHGQVALGIRETQNARRDSPPGKSAGRPSPAAVTPGEQSPGQPTTAPSDAEPTTHIFALTSRSGPDWDSYHRIWLGSALEWAQREYRSQPCRAGCEAVLQAIANLSKLSADLSTGVPVVAVGIRSLAVSAGLCTPSAVAKNLRRIRRSSNPPIELRSPGHGRAADSYALVLPLGQQFAPVNRVEAVHDAWSLIGLVHRRVYDQIPDLGSISTKDIALTARISLRTAQLSLLELQRWQLIDRRRGVVSRGSSTLDQIAREQSVLDIRDRRAEQNREDREIWRRRCITMAKSTTTAHTATPSEN